MIFIALGLFALSVYFFIRFIIKRDKGYKEPTGALFTALGFGVVAVFAAGILNSIFIPEVVIDGIGKGGGQAVPWYVLLASSIGVGIIEESLKCLPFALFVYKKRYFDELTDGVIYFGIIGLTFGVIEDILYSLEFGGGVGIMRVLISPYLHASFSILFGMYLIQKKVLKRSWIVVVLGFAAAILSHGIYDFFAFTGGLVGAIIVLTITITLNVMLFIIFRRSQRLDELAGKSAVGINKFCRQCGHPNPDTLLFCTSCGKHT